MHPSTEGGHVRGLVLERVEEIVLHHDLPSPRVIDPRDAVVRVEVAGLCGSDLHPYSGRERGRFGIVQGHEVVGVVEEVGTAVREISVGDRVLVPFTTSCGTCASCRSGLTASCVESQLFGWGPPDGPESHALHGGQAEALRVPLADGTLVRVPEGIDDLTALLLCDNAPTGWYGAVRAEVGLGSRVAIIGCGAVGLCTIVAAKALGAAEVLAVDPVPARRAAAASLGATAVDPSEATGRFDAVVEAAGPAAAQDLAGHLADVSSTVSIVAVQTAWGFGISPTLAYDRNLTIRTGRAPVRSVLESLLPRVAAGEVVLPTDLVVTERDVDLADGPDAYRRFADREGNLVKLAFRP